MSEAKIAIFGNKKRKNEDLGEKVSKKKKSEKVDTKPTSESDKKRDKKTEKTTKPETKAKSEAKPESSKKDKSDSSKKDNKPNSKNDTSIVKDKKEDSESAKKRLFVSAKGGNLTKKLIIDIFKKYGKLADIRMKSSYSRIEFDTQQDAEKAIAENGKVHQGITLGVVTKQNVKKETKKETKKPQEKKKTIQPKKIEKGKKTVPISPIGKVGKIKTGEYMVHVDYKFPDGKVKTFTKSGGNLGILFSVCKAFFDSSKPAQKIDYWSLILSHLPGSRCKYEITERKEGDQKVFDSTIILYGNKDFKETGKGNTTEEAKLNALANLFSTLKSKNLVKVEKIVEPKSDKESEKINFDDLEDIGE